jgi:hypothetical protein
LTHIFEASLLDRLAFFLSQRLYWYLASQSWVLKTPFYPSPLLLRFLKAEEITILRLLYNFTTALKVLSINKR